MATVMESQRVENKPGDVHNQIHHPFTAGPLLVNPLRGIDVSDLVLQQLKIILIGDQKRLF